MQVKGSGSNFTVTETTISDSAFTEVTPPTRFNSALIKCRTAVALYIKRLTADTEYFTIPASQALELDINGTDANTFFLKSASGSVTAEILWSL